jgi:hypothetical protein
MELQEEVRQLTFGSAEIYGGGVTALLAKVSEGTLSARHGDFLRSRSAMADRMRRQSMVNHYARAWEV